jgi:hypothetical protein
MEGLCADFGMKPGGAISQAQFIAVLKTELRAAAAAAAADGGGSGDGAFVAADSLRANGAATAGASGAGAAVTAATERQVLTSRQASAFSGPSMSPFAAAAAASIGGEAAAALPPASSVVSSTAEGGALMPGLSVPTGAAARFRAAGHAVTAASFVARGHINANAATQQQPSTSVAALMRHLTSHRNSLKRGSASAALQAQPTLSLDEIGDMLLVQQQQQQQQQQASQQQQQQAPLQNGAAANAMAADCPLLKDEDDDGMIDPARMASIRAAAATAVRARALPPPLHQLQTIFVRSAMRKVSSRSAFMADLALTGLLGLALGAAQGQNSAPDMLIMWLVITLLAYGCMSLARSISMYGDERTLYLQLESRVSSTPLKGHGWW